MSEKLSLLDNSSDSDVELTVNKGYANSYNQWRNKEELQKYKDLKKDEEDSESSSESEEEIPEFDEEFFRALSLLKGKDPRIYDKNFELFKEKEVVKKSKDAKQKPVFIKDYERNLVLERGGKFSDEDDEDNEGNAPNQAQKFLYDEEQERKLKMFKEEAYQGSNDSDDDADLLQVRTKSKEEEEAEEADYVKWLKGEEKEVSEDVKKDMACLRNYWNDPELDEGEKFLKDYILNKRYLEKDESEIPTYEELTSGRLSDDEKMVEEQEKFEHKYNFRFEEPDEEFIKRYPRTIGDSLRRTDNRRKQKREERAERKTKEREQRKEELKRLKALKRKEIEEKFMKLKEISGHDEINLNESDIESDFDPDKHDQKMGEMFNDDYYQVEENQKPEFPYDEELDSENWNAWTGEKIVDDEDVDENTTVNEEDEEGNHSKLNFKEDFANEMINASRPKKQMKKKSLFAKIISQPKPIYDPDGKAFEEYLDEYYKLDYEDVIGDMPVRYKYRKVIPNDFGLSVDEILTADDKELNRWCSVKKTCQYRKDQEELYDVQAFHKKAKIPLIKKKFFPSVYAPKETEDPVVDSNNLDSETRDSENVMEKSKDENGVMEFNESGDNQQEVKHDSAAQIPSKKKSKKKKRKGNQDISVTESEPRSTLSTKDIDENNGDQEEVKHDSETQNSSKKKSKKKKRKGNQDISVTESEPGSTLSTVDIDTKGKECQNSSVMDMEYESSIATEMNIKSDTNKRHSSNFKEGSSHKSVKRKHCGNDSLVDSDSEIDNTVRDLSPKSKHKSVSHSNSSPSLNSVSENTTEAPTKKKKKKKNKKKKHRPNEAPETAVAQGNKLTLHHNKLQNRHKQHAAGDKRLGLSDERLAAYGINPKKFKNKIIYSKKKFIY